MKILFLSHRFYPDIGGIEVNSEILAEKYGFEGNEVHLITWTKQKGKKTFPYKVVRNPSIYVLIKEHIWADIVYENNPCLRLSWPSFVLRKPRVIALRTWVSRKNGTITMQDKIKLFWISKAKAVIAVSNAVRLRSWENATVIGNPYRKNLFNNKTKGERGNSFAFLGRLVSDKGADLAINALNSIIKDTSDTRPFTFSIIGDGPELNSLKKLVNDLKLANNVSFKGVLRGQELVNSLNEHKFLLVPSIWEEPFGNIALEGMACGCIPIVSDGGGLPDAVGNAGLVFKRGDLDSLINAIRKIINNKELEIYLQKEAPKHLKEHYPEVIARKYLEVINNAII
ncbi:Glycosyltransferase involved in cell wall bisynthesis [Flaviramulus basaltis]|uniref:Glycosyltransferase involved in cell wall bisynthesis n=1 Tax=Flaviramulus basaltis TaxID=369401 RepID=A0A1K2IP45_9FLAO|nr:glycosyltransferase family 4 protein [Flaviramulus basaltis]SFZ94026.1 Glycosyltransferase involved in cell wall bisynthesis [Flaviramulus basaltis]